MKLKTKSFRTKLWLYFILFAAIIFSLLWILQTVFLQSFYNNMLKSNTRKAASQIASSSESDDFYDSVDKLAHENSLLIFITDTEGKVYYSSDSHKTNKESENKKGAKEKGRRGAGEGNGQTGIYRNLPEDYLQFMSDLSDSENGKSEYTTGDQFILVEYITLSDGERALLYVSATLGAVGATAQIVRTILIWVTFLSLIIAFVIAFYIAKRFSKPIDQLSSQAKALGDEKYVNGFRKGFCKELDDLSGSIDEAAFNLSEAKKYQKELLSNVSHDLRTPLTMIRGYAEMIRDVSGNEKEKRDKDLEIIIRESKRLEALVNEILEYSHLQETDIKREFEDVNLGKLTSRVADGFAPLLSIKGITIEKKADENCIIRGDAHLLERAVYNLIDNAIKHTGNSKKISVSVSSGEKIILKVRDYGQGISEELLPHIWEKYYTSRQRNDAGVSGLGLPIVKQIAVIHNASYGVESKENEGSCFRLEFAKQ